MGLLIQPVGKSPVITTSKKAEEPAEQAPLSAAEQRKKDRMELSKAALSYVQSVAERQEKILQKQEAQKNKLAQYGDISQQIAQANEQATATADAQNEQFKTMNRCSKIAANVMSGKKVPLKDLQYLMKHDSKLYQMAMAMRRPPKDDKECDSVLKDGDDESSDSASSAVSDASASSSPAAGGSAEAPAPAAEAAPSEGGGAE